MNVRLQFSLRQLLLATTLLAVCLGVAKWYYIKRFDRVLRVSAEGGLDRCNGLDSYLGKRVSFSGTYQHTGSSPSHQIVWFGTQPIVLVGTRTNSAPLRPVRDGASVTVTGRLRRAPMDTPPAVTEEGGTWFDGHRVWQQVSVAVAVIYSLDVEGLSAAAAE